MEALEFLEEAKRMCEGRSSCTDKDKVCPIYDAGNESCIGTILSNTEKDKFIETVNAVEEWSAAHQCKTRQSVFLEHWPNAKVFVDGVLDFCPRELDSSYPCQSTDIEMRCQPCRRKFWMQEIE